MKKSSLTWVLVMILDITPKAETTKSKIKLVGFHDKTFVQVRKHTVLQILVSKCK